MKIQTWFFINEVTSSGATILKDFYEHRIIHQSGKVACLPQ